MKSKVKGGGAVSFNMTPMIDIVFNLIIFFMLVSTFSQMATVPVELPPAEKAENKKDELGKFTPVVINAVYVSPNHNQVVVNGEVVIDDLQGPQYDIPDVSRLEKALADLKEAAKDKPLLVIYRADGRIHYDLTGRVMAAVTLAGIPEWWVQAELPNEKDPADRIKMKELGLIRGEVGR